MASKQSRTAQIAPPDQIQQTLNDLPTTRNEELGEEPIQVESQPTAETGTPWWVAFLPAWSRRPIVVLIVLSGLALPVAANFNSYRLSRSEQPTQNQIVSRTDYELLKLGMSITDAQARIGRGVEISSDAVTVVYRWTNGDGSQITAAFKNNRLISKEQSGLR